MKKTFYYWFCLTLLLLHPDLSFGQLTVSSPANGAVVNQCGTYILHFNPGSGTTAYAAAEVHLNNSSGPIVQTLGYPSGYLSMNYDNIVHASSLTVGNSYQIKVYDASNPSFYGWSGIFTVGGATPPTSVSAMLIDWGWLEISWPQVVGASSYLIDVATSSNFTTGVVWSGHSATGLDSYGLYINSLSASTTYYVRIKTVSSACGTSGYSSVYSFTTLPCVPPAPTALAATNVKTSSFTANWTAVSRASNGYRVLLYRNDLAPVTYDFPDGTTSHTFDPVHPSSDYAYYVYTKGSCSNSSSSNGIGLTTGALAVPVLTTANGGGGGGSEYDLYIHWNAVDGASYYRFQVSLYSDFHSFILDTTEDSNVGIFSKSQCAEYYVRVQSVAATGETSAFCAAKHIDQDAGCGGRMAAPTPTEEEPVLTVDEEPIEQFELFPNPSERYVTVNLPTTFNVANLVVQTIDARGNRVTVPFGVTKSSATFDLSNISPGMYLVTLSDGTTKYRSRFLRK